MSRGVESRLGRVVFWPFALVARARGWRWALLVAFECFFAALFGAILFATTGSIPVPDIGDPFDVDAFRAEKVEHDRNAYEWFILAHDALKPPQFGFDTTSLFNVPLPGRKEEPRLGEWLDSNQIAVERFLEGARRPDALLPRYGLPGDRLVGRFQSRYNLTGLMALVREEGGRRQQRGDLAGSWDCHFAVLRACRLICRHATVVDRMLAEEHRKHALLWLSVWSGDPRMKPEMLRKALDDVYSLDSLSADDEYTIKAEYIDTVKILQMLPTGWGNTPEEPPANGVRPFGSSWVRYLTYPLRRTRAREPEFSIRVLRLMTAQRLAYLRIPPELRPPAAIRVVERLPFGAFRTEFYEPDPSAPPAARAVSARALAEAFAGTFDLKGLQRLFWTQFWSIRKQEANDRMTALHTIAEALYLQEHPGAPPPTIEELLPYLRPEPQREPESAPLADDPTPELSPSAP